MYGQHARNERTAMKTTTTKTTATLICGYRVQSDLSGGQGHCWRDVAPDSFGGNREELECWLIEERPAPGDATIIGGIHYRVV